MTLADLSIRQLQFLPAKCCEQWCLTLGGQSSFGFRFELKPAEAIASKAQPFGQDDDITVLNFLFAGVPASR
jgi:hypothetical protein